MCQCQSISVMWQRQNSLLLQRVGAGRHDGSDKLTEQSQIKHVTIYLSSDQSDKSVCLDSYKKP